MYRKNGSVTYGKQWVRVRETKHLEWVDVRGPMLHHVKPDELGLQVYAQDAGRLDYPEDDDGEARAPARNGENLGVGGGVGAVGAVGGGWGRLGAVRGRGREDEGGGG